MKNVSRILASFVSVFAVFLFVFGAAPQSRAAKAGLFVRYDPLSQSVYGTLPAMSTYTLNVTAPEALTSFPVTVSLQLTPTAIPVGDAATALTYVRFSSPTLTFTQPGQTLPVTVTLDFPLTALSLQVPAGAYMYQINTVGWPAGIIDSGSSISATVSSPVSDEGAPPTVTIDSPADNTVFTFSLGQLPAQIPFSFTATVPAQAPVITSVSAMFGGATGSTVVPVTASGLGSSTATGSGYFTVTKPGVYTLQASAINSVGAAQDTSVYTIVVTGVPPPTVTIASPTPGSSYTYTAGGSAVVVPLTFQATSSFGGIRALTATLDGASLAFVSSGLDTLVATGSVSLPYTTAGAHTVVVTAVDDYGSAVATTNFTINVIAPTPTVAISAPLNGQTITLAPGVLSANVPYLFRSTSNNGFVVDAVTATLGSTTLTPTTVGLGAPIATSSGALQNLGPGSYTLTATATSAGITVQDTVSFTIVGSTIPPSVTINTPPVGSIYTRVAGGPAVSVPLTFTGVSNTVGGVITALSATLDGSPVAVTAANLGQKTAFGSATLAVTTAGTHTISVTAVDAYGTASASRTFVVTVLEGVTVSGQVFFDANANGVMNSGEFGLSGVTVNLLSSRNQVVKTAVTDATGRYAFAKVAAGNYTVAGVPSTGLVVTTPKRVITVGATDVAVGVIGFGLNFCALDGMKANGFTIGYWKNNLEKAVSGKKNGVQVSKAALTAYTNAIAEFGLSPFDGLTMSGAVSVMSSNSSKPTDLLAKQLLASEYNYQNGAYLNGNGTLTMLFIWWGEYVLSHPSEFSSTYIIWAKDWFDAYNNTHGGAIDGPSS